ncbi:hypothetical protein CUC08_Gglean011530 [Alternaria sp. MG1]|nr:hypothetical protein CUC08_Gglean011530 [Alternaria sp. MG1]
MDPYLGMLYRNVLSRASLGPTVLTIKVPTISQGFYYQSAPSEITRDELRATASTRIPIVRKVIEDFCNASERLEQIGAMIPTSSGLQYWVKDSVTMESILVAECYWLLQLVPGYRSRVPTEVRVAFEALTTPELRSRALLHSLSHYLQYINWRLIQTLQAQGQALQIQGSSLQPSFRAPTIVHQPAAQPIRTIVLTRFFPRAASSWRALWKRFDAAGWTLSMLRMLIYWQRSLGTVDLRAHSFGSMKKHRRDAQNHHCSAAGFTLDSISTDRVSSNVDFNDLRDCFLVSLGDGLAHFPQGADQGRLTIAVLHARRHNHNNVRLSQVEQYITQVGLDTQYNLPGPSLVSIIQADQAARDRLFPDHNSDPARRHDPNYDLIRMWWRTGGYSHDV